MKIVLSLGTSNKTFSHFLKELKNYKITTVVDVRDIPQSRFYPHFNQKRLSEGLRENNVEYVWMGETLGNPKKGSGRTLEGFAEHQKTLAYQNGLAELKNLIQNDGSVAIICAEADERQCHRQFILKDLKEIFAQEDVSFC